jgi:hypothetical protein
MEKSEILITIGGEEEGVKVAKTFYNVILEWPL